MMSKQTRNERDDLQLEANRGHHGMLNTTPELQVVMKGSSCRPWMCLFSSLITVYLAYSHFAKCTTMIL